MSAASYNKILIVNPFGIGDAIFSMYLVEALKKNLPQTQIGFLGNERVSGLLRMNRSIDVCHEFNRDEFRALKKRNSAAFLFRLLAFAASVKKERYGAMFDLSLGREFGFAGACLGIRRRIGFNFKRRGLWLTHRTKLEAYEKKHVVEWQAGLLEALNLKAGDIPAKLPLVVSVQAAQEARNFLAQHGVVEGAAVLAVAPGGGKSWGSNATYKQWAPERFAEAVEQSRSAGHTVALLLGDAEEKPLLEKAKNALSVPAVVAAGLRLEVVCALLQKSRALLCNDGGLLHLANALGVSTASMYGPVDEKVYGPYGAGVRREVLTEAVPCRPCYHKFHFPPCGHDRRCLEELSVEKVSAALQKICYSEKL